jgi:Carbohydrate esterase, sialic acid-specific acetylesterase
MQELTPDRHIAIIKHAWSGTNLYKDWAPGKDAYDSANWGSQFSAFVDTVNQGIAELQRRGDRPIIRGMLWQQGESDAADAGSEYAANLTHFIARVREQFKRPDMVFVYGYVCPPPGNRNGCEVIRQAEHDLDQDSGSPLAVTNAFVVETDDLSQRATDPDTPLPGDHVHFGSAGTLGLGTRFADRMYQHLRELR